MADTVYLTIISGSAGEYCCTVTCTQFQLNIYVTIIPRRDTKTCKCGEMVYHFAIMFLYCNNRNTLKETAFF